MTESPPPSPFDEASEVPERALRIYARLWQFETWLRQMVYVELRALAGDNWSAGLRVNERAFQADKSLKHMPTPEMNALSYSQLSDLMALIREHWACFEPYLPPQALWEAKVSEISQIRHRIAHFRVGHADDYQRLRQFLRDIDQGFWTFCTNYNAGGPILPQSDDPVTTHFLELDPIPWSEIEPRKWAQVGHVDRSPVIGMTVQVITRPWATATQTVDGQSGHLYDFNLMSYDRKFDYPKVLEATRRLHPHFAHISLGGHEDTMRLTLPTILGTAKVIGLIEEFLEYARYGVSRSRSPVVGPPDAVAEEWPEYVLGPRDPLTFLSPDMKCSFFGI